MKKLNESLRFGDLKTYVDETFTIDRYTSKMGEDTDVVVVGFNVKDKMAAEDLMSFIEKGYQFILDSDMSTGEEEDGNYQVFAEIQRTKDIGEHLESLLSGVGQLCDCKHWNFIYRNGPKLEFSKSNILEHVPNDPIQYEQKVRGYKQADVQNFFDQGSVEVVFESNNTLIFSKPYAEPLQVKFIAMGNYDDIKHLVPGKLNLDENSQGKCVYLNKYLGNYDIDKIDNKFLISNGDRSIIIEKERW